MTTRHNRLQREGNRAEKVILLIAIVSFFVVTFWS